MFANIPLARLSSRQFLKIAIWSPLGVVTPPTNPSPSIPFQDCYWPLEGMHEYDGGITVELKDTQEIEESKITKRTFHIAIEQVMVIKVSLGDWYRSSREYLILGQTFTVDLLKLASVPNQLILALLLKINLLVN